jgi:DNA-binding winged helix-turn-helix (wHTH) protein/predicted ATPase
LVTEVGQEKRIVFDPFSLDLANECLWKGSQAIKLRPKAFAVLVFLLRRPGQLVAKEELLDAVWSGTFVGEAVLKVAIRQIRESLEDDPSSPRFIETAHRRGYRFIGSISESGGSTQAKASANRSSSADSASVSYPSESHQRVVGREDSFLKMRGAIGRMLGGERQIIFVTGEAGIGKTSLVDTFARGIVSDGKIRIGRGQCLEQYGTSEAYLPVLEAVGRLCREHPPLVDVLRAHAPMWLLQMPSLLSATDRELLSREVFGATRERMLREMGEALEAMAADMPLVLILEDLHWSDYSTLDLISYLARQRQPTQLMLIGTYRPVELIVSGHPLKAVKSELLARQQCEELPLEYLTEDAVAKYLSIRYPNNRFPEQFVGLIHKRTEGNPLFMVNAIDYLETQNLVGPSQQSWELLVEIENVQVGVPESIRQMIEKQVEHLSASEQRTLETASVAGAEFSTLLVASGLLEDRAVIEARCDELARQRQFIQDSGVQVLPNGDAVSRYGFIHALYQNVLYDRLSPFRRIQLHLRIGEQAEALYGEHSNEIAAELAMHFERGANYTQAARYLQHAADNDLRRFAYRDAVALSRHGLELIERLPDTPDRARQELGLHITLGAPLIATEGYAAPGVRSHYARARDLCRQLGRTPEIAQALWGLWTFHMVRSELGTAREIAEEFLRLAEDIPYSRLTMEVTLMHLGEFEPALEHFDQALRLYDPERHRNDSFRYSQNSGVASQSHAAWALWFVGLPDQAMDRIEKAMSLARELSEPHGMAHSLFFASVVHQLRRDEAMTRVCAEAAFAISAEHGLLLYQATTTVTRGWTLIEEGRAEEAIELIRQGLAGHRATGTELLRPHFLALLAEALRKAKRIEEGLEVLEDALAQAQSNGDCYFMPEIYRLKGEMLLVSEIGKHPAAGAERCLNQALESARKQKARSLELRAAMSLSRLYQSRKQKAKARELLEPVYAGFTEGFGTKDLREAKMLLEELA